MYPFRTGGSRLHQSFSSALPPSEGDVVDVVATKENERNNCKCILPAMHRRNAVKVVAVVLVRVGVVVVEEVEVVVLLVAIGRIRADQNSRRRSAHFEVCYVKKVDALRV